MFKFFKPKAPRPDPYGIAPWPPRSGHDNIDGDPVTVALAQQVADQRVGRIDKPMSKAERQGIRPSFAPNDPVYWAGVR